LDLARRLMALHARHADQAAKPIAREVEESCL
jgi:hypothetical protein